MKKKKLDELKGNELFNIIGGGTSDIKNVEDNKKNSEGSSSTTQSSDYEMSNGTKGVLGAIGSIFAALLIRSGWQIYKNQKAADETRRMITSLQSSATVPERGKTAANMLVGRGRGPLVTIYE